MLHLAENKFDEIEQKYRKINLIDWKEEGVFQDNVIPTDASQYWIVL